jgi:NAD(P)-dependent dehydrogenase (short-subunit alcohol dehydrogenase family)
MNSTKKMTITEMPDSKIWFITGASRGFGRIWAEAALRRGDMVAVTARKVADIADLVDQFGESVLPLALDVTESKQVRQVVAKAHSHFGRLDVVVNNAGYTLVGTVEEASEADFRAVFDTNLFGMVRVIQAALPLLRKQGNGHFLNVTSSLGVVPMPLIGFYCASKAAAESINESLAAEVKSFGIKVTMIEPGAYATEFASPKSMKTAPGMASYAHLRARVFKSLSTTERGDPQATAGAILKIVDANAPPLRFILDSSSLPQTRITYADRVATWEAWGKLSNSAQGESKKAKAAAKPAAK